MLTHTKYTNLRCLSCQKSYDKDRIQNYCHQCHQPLVAEYDLSSSFSRDVLFERPLNMWRYLEVLPIERKENIVSLGEGMTPILPLHQIAKKWGIQNLQIKDESGNPTGSFKARGLAMAVSKGKELGIDKFCIPTAGNAGSALSAYAAKMGGEAHVFMPEKTPQVFQMDCEIMGANVTKVKGSIKDAGAAMAGENKEGKWWDVTTLKEPFRLEGKKTMGYEIAEQYNWEMPDVIIYPTGGGTGLIGIWKAINEMLQLGWINAANTRMVAVQTKACDPIVQAFEKGEASAKLFENPEVTIANGLRVPKAFGDRLILSTLYESNGTALSISDKEIKSYMSLLARTEGLFISPEGAAVLAAAHKLVNENYIQKNDKVLLLNTGSAYKYIENMK